MKSHLYNSGFDFQNNYITVVQYAPEEQNVTKIAILPLAYDDPSAYWETVGNELKNLKKTFKFSNPEAVCSLPSEHSVVKKIIVDWSEGNLAQAMEWELSQQIIAPVEEYVFDYQQIPSVGDEKVYLLVAMRKEKLARLSEAVKNIKLNPATIDLDSFALINVFEANYPELLADPVLIVHSEPLRTKLVLSAGGHFVDSAFFQHDDQSIEQQEYCDIIARETARLTALNSAEVAGGDPRIFLAGSLFAQQKKNGAFNGVLSDAQMLNPFRKINCQIGAEESQLENYSAQLAVAVGLALRGNE